MSERKNGDISKQEQDLRALLKSEIQSEEYQNLKTQVRKGKHPTRDILYDYVAGDLNDQEAGIVRRHLLFCEICTDEVARLMRIEQHVDEELEKWAEQADIVSAPQQVEELPPVSAPIIELPGVVATDYWTPQWAGELLTAADMTEQEYTFALQEGEIRLRCYWQGEHDDEPAYIRLSWDADITRKRELWARFITTDTQDVLSEVPLGTDLSGEKILTRHVLGFNPTTKPWAVAIVLRPIKS